ncbi:hypothetical protein [Haloarcula onubensis]|uniref:Zinc ribbon domain-containing protein n=1 Tax=Haloarcula onubensis TaxID=2950539 RepID=A0ABU2FQU3_9EURY|nr:hypothetical protein [Halomicroarcula sp. S3CR25-11]MDS0282622.1 zinc ribbon domain-containing protein [Halomicroarcula sp. S3CR25-11]
MDNVADDIPPADRLPVELVERLDALDTQQLRAVSDYVDERLAHAGPPTEAAVRADTARTVVDVARRDLYTLVWTRSEETAAENGTSRTALYLVQRERTLDGDEQLHWAYLGAVRDTMECDECGAVVGPDDNCPRCGSGPTRGE